ncbi:glycosyltransferase family 39 protein [Nonomuraea wenchangensis]
MHASARRLFTPRAGLPAGAVMALTPVAVLMFRFNNPDALLVLLLTAAGYCVVRAQERGATRWLVLAGAAIGFAFLAKMLQAFLVLPGFVLVYLVTAPVPVRRRIGQLLAAGAALVAAAGGAGAARRGHLADQAGGAVRAAFWVWGSWLVVTGLVFSLMRGIFHAYYTVALAPAVAVLVGMGVAALWERGARRALAVVVMGTAAWSYVLLSRSVGWNPWLWMVVVVAGLGGARRRCSER